MDKVHISAFPDHLISHEDMPGQHTKRGGPQDLKCNTQLFMYFIGANLKSWSAKGTLPKHTGDLSMADREQEEFPGSKGITLYSYQPPPSSTVKHTKQMVLAFRSCHPL